MWSVWESAPSATDPRPRHKRGRAQTLMPPQNETPKQARKATQFDRNSSLRRDELSKYHFRLEQQRILQLRNCARIVSCAQPCFAAYPIFASLAGTIASGPHSVVRTACTPNLVRSHPDASWRFACREGQKSEKPDTPNLHMTGRLTDPSRPVTPTLLSEWFACTAMRCNALQCSDSPKSG